VPVGRELDPVAQPRGQIEQEGRAVLRAALAHEPRGYELGIGVQRYPGPDGTGTRCREPRWAITLILIIVRVPVDLSFGWSAVGQLQTE
jgi:hypothetical protein